MAGVATVAIAFDTQSGLVLLPDHFLQEFVRQPLWIFNRRQALLLPPLDIGGDDIGLQLLVGSQANIGVIHRVRHFSLKPREGGLGIGPLSGLGQSSEKRPRSLM